MKTTGLLTKAITTFALSAVLATPVLAPLTAYAGKKKSEPIDLNKLVWPSPPEVTRIKWVAEYHGSDIKGVKKQGMLERLAGVEAPIEKDTLVKPLGIAVDSKGRAFVSDSQQKLVFVFDLEKKTLSYLGDKPPASFRMPSGITVDDKDRVFVADAQQHNITVFSPEGEVVTIFGEDQLTRPSGLAVDVALNRLYVADVKERKVGVFDLTTFKFQRWIGKSWTEKVEPEDADKVLNAPTNLAVDLDGNIYVVDTFLDRVTVFDTDGEYVRRLGDIGAGPGRFMRPRGVAVDVDGHVYITDGMANNFQVLTSEGRAMVPIGTLGTAPAAFIVPAGIVVDKFNRIIVVDQGNRRIQLFRYVTDEEAAKQGGNTQTASAKDKKK